MKIIKLLLATILSSGVIFADTDSKIDIKTNVAIASNYIWRGMTLSANSPAIQGGLDLSYKGFYIGTWGSNVNFHNNASMELDLYAGYTNKINNIDYDVGYLQYIYPNESDNLNFAEAYFALGYDFDIVAIDAKYFVGVDTNDAKDPSDDWTPKNSIEAGITIPLPKDISFKGRAGKYVGTGVYYLTSFCKSFKKFDLSLEYTGMHYDNSTKENEDHVLAIISTSF